MKIAVRIGVKGVVFHTNISPVLSGVEYDQRAIEMTVEYLECLLKRYHLSAIQTASLKLCSKYFNERL